MAGPFFKTISEPTHYLYREWRTQPKPRKKPLVYVTRKGFVGNSFGGDQVGIPRAEYCEALNWVRDTVNAEAEATLAEAASQGLKEKLRGSSASLGVALAEAPDALALISGASARLIRGYKALRRGNLRGVAKELDVTTKRVRNAVTAKKELSSKWLALHFGWQPLIQDCYDAVNLLTSTPTIEELTATRTYRENREGRPGPTYDWVANGSLEVGVRVRGTMRVTNPNLFLLERAGLLNPLTVAWELIPFSFLVDWFANIGGVLNSLTDGIGATYDGSVTWRRTAFVQSRFVAEGTDPLTGLPRQPRAAYSSGAFTLRRETGWSGGTSEGLRLDFGLPNWKRIVTGVALGLQIFGK